MTSPQEPLVEPTVVLCRCGDDELRVPIWPDRGSYDVPGARVAHLDDRGRWLSHSTARPQTPDGPSGKVISTALFVRNIGVLSRYLAATRP